MTAVFDFLNWAGTKARVCEIKSGAGDGRSQIKSYLTCLDIGSGPLPCFVAGSDTGLILGSERCALGKLTPRLHLVSKMQPAYGWVGDPVSPACFFTHTFSLPFECILRSDR